MEYPQGRADWGTLGAKRTDSWSTMKGITEKRGNERGNRVQEKKKN